jgi:hypothetical protein
LEHPCDLPRIHEEASLAIGVGAGEVPVHAGDPGPPAIDQDTLVVKLHDILDVSWENPGLQAMPVHRRHLVEPSDGLIVVFVPLDVVGPPVEQDAYLHPPRRRVKEGDHEWIRVPVPPPSQVEQLHIDALCRVAEEPQQSLFGRRVVRSEEGCHVCR